MSKRTILSYSENLEVSGFFYHQQICDGYKGDFHG